jgi:hypothetical protein
MLIHRVEIENFRSLKSIDLDCGRMAEESDRSLVAILGRNGGGKSSALYALDIFYDVGARITTEDFYNYDPSKPIMIRVTYGNLRADERNEFKSYIENDCLIVTKRFSAPGTGKYFAAAKQIPQFAELRKLGARDRTNRYKQLVTDGTLPGLSGNPRSADQTNSMMDEYEGTHPDLVQTVEREEQFFGPKEIGGGKLDKFTKFVLVPAVRNAAHEGEKRGVIYELIDTIVLRQVNKRPDVRNLRAEMEEKIKRIFCQENLTELGGLGTAISKVLDRYSPGSELRLTWGDPEIPIIPLPKANAELVEDDFPCPISHTGHGLQRCLILTILQYLAMVERPAEDDDDKTTTPESGELAVKPPVAIFNPDLILAIEEPELYLHPSRCRHLSELFLALTKKPADANTPRNQIVYATHSPYFVDLHRFDQVRIARKNTNADGSAPCCVISQYSLSEAARELARVAGKDQKDFTRDSFRARSLPVMTVAMNEGFFAHAVVAVEGLSDVGALWTVQTRMNKQWAALGIAIVPAIGKTNLDRPVVVFRGLKIPTYFIFDGDASHKGKGSDNENQTKERNALCQRLAHVTKTEDFPSTQVHEFWAVYHHDLEAVLKDAADDKYNEVTEKAVKELGYSGASVLLKNTEGAARLVELIYEAGKTIPVLEQIVQKVTALCAPSGKSGEPIKEIKPEKGTP